MGALDHFAVLWQTPESTAAGVTVTCGTNHPCHLWLRYTLHSPWVHITRGMTRGAPMALLPRYCFTTFTDVEQEEAGDTIHHTFLIAPWMVGETRWYYFLGTINGTESKSRSALFEYTRVAIPVTAYFYPDADPEVTTVDGFIQCNSVSPWNWFACHSGPANVVDSGGLQMHLIIQSGDADSPWWILSRAVALFDTSAIPLGSDILSARLRLRRSYLAYPPEWDSSSTSIVFAWPTVNTHLSFADYSKFATVRFTNTVGITDPLDGDGFWRYDFKDEALIWIIAGGITRLGIRESAHDIANRPPSPWLRRTKLQISFWTAEKGVGYKPELRVVYKPP